MTTCRVTQVGLMWHGDSVAREAADLTSSRFAGLAAALAGLGLEPVAVVYNDDFAEVIREQLLGLDAIQVWVNPISGGQDRTVLDALLRDVASQGTLVFTHPDTIMKLGTKRVLFELKNSSIGSEVYEHSSLESLRSGLAQRLPVGARVVKQFRGHSGGGIWLIAPTEHSEQVILRHAERGCPEEQVRFEQALDRMRPYFEGGNSMFEQPYQERIGEGMVRVYLVGKDVAGFGHQEAVAGLTRCQSWTFPPRVDIEYHKGRYEASKLQHQFMKFDAWRMYLSLVFCARDVASISSMYSRSFSYGGTSIARSLATCSVNVDTLTDSRDSI